MDYKDKIRKLLALAKSPEPEEAKFALLKARKLMAEHKLSERDLKERNTTVIKRAIRETFSKKANSWMDPLSIVIGENYCCSAFRCKISAKTTVWHVGFIGLEGDIEICVKIFRYAVRCIKSEQKKLRKQHRDYYTPQEIAKICDSYGYGFARGVYEAFTRQNEENQEYGLVLKVPKEVKDELEKIGPPKEFKKDAPAKDCWRARRSMARHRGRQEIRPVKQAGRKETGGITNMASTKFEVSMEIFKFQGEPDVSVTLTGKSPTELETALKTLETIAKTTTLYDGNSAPEAEKNVPNEPQQAAPVVSSADKKAPPPEKPVSWLTPVGAKGLMLLRCPKCKSEFVQFLREPQTTNECRKCGAKIPLDALARFEFTCPACKKVSYGRTNIEDAEITNQKFSCVCGRSIPKLTWNPAKRCYTA